jgi:hypothetical protein
LFTFLRVMGLFFRSKAPGLIFSVPYPCPAHVSGAPHSPDKSGAAASPTDTSRKGRRPPASHFRKALQPSCFSACHVNNLMLRVVYVNCNTRRKRKATANHSLSPIRHHALLAIPALALTAMVLCGDICAAQTAEGSGRRDTVSGHHGNEWTGHISYVLGYKGLEKKWAPAKDQVEFGLIDFDIKRADWPVSFAAQLLLTYDSDIPNLASFMGDQSGTFEFNVGLRKILGRLPRYQPFLGGGSPS